MKTILHIENATGVTGAYKALFSFCKNYNQARHIWVVPKGSHIISELKKSFTVYELPFVEIGKSPFKLIKYVPFLISNGRSLNKIIEKEKPDVIHVNDFYNLSPYFIKPRYRKNIPLIVHARMLKRSFPSILYKFWVKTHLKKTDAIIAVSQAIKNDWGGNEKVEVIYDPVFIKERYPRYDFLSKERKVFRFVYLANYMPEKGQRDCLMAIASLVKITRQPFIVDFYGSTLNQNKNELYKNSLIVLAKELGIEDKVAINDAVSDVEGVFKKYHCLLHFSHSESFGMVCYEGLYYGLPVISTACGGPEEMIKNNYNGLLIPVKDFEAQANAMNLLLSDPAKCSALSENAYHDIRQKFGSTSDKLNKTFDRFLHIDHG